MTQLNERSSSRTRNLRVLRGVLSPQQCPVVQCSAVAVQPPPAVAVSPVPSVVDTAPSLAVSSALLSVVVEPALPGPRATESTIHSGSVQQTRT